MATLKEHQAAMVDLLANGSGIPASASRLAHAMHDVLAAVLLNAPLSPIDNQGRAQETTPGLNDKALAEDIKALQVNSPAKWPINPAERRVKELENTVKHLKGHNAKPRQENQDLRDDIGDMASKLHIVSEQRDNLGRNLAEQAGCRKPDVEA